MPVSSANVVAVNPSELAAERYRALVRQLGEEAGHHYGWKSQVARLLNVHPSYITRIANGEDVSVGAEAVDRAMKALDLAPRFFYEPHLVHAHYTNHQVGELSTAGPITSHVNAGDYQRTLSDLEQRAERLLQLGTSGAFTDAHAAEARDLAERVMRLPLVRWARRTLEEATAMDSADASERIERLEDLSMSAITLAQSVRLLANPTGKRVRRPDPPPK